MNISEIQIIPVKPHDGLVAFASFVLDNRLYLGSIGILTRPEGGYRLLFPTKKLGVKNIHIYHPIEKSFAESIEIAIIKKFKEVQQRSW